VAQIAEYAFTTLHPQLGTVHVPDAPWEEAFSVADIPGKGYEEKHSNTTTHHPVAKPPAPASTAV